MIYLSLEIAEAGPNTGRYNDAIEQPGWVPLASSQARTEEEAKSLMLDNVLEMLNNEDLLPKNQWLRLVHYADDHATVTKVENF